MKIAFQSNPTTTNPLTTTGLASLTNGSTSTSAVIDNYNAGLNLFDDIEFIISITTAASATSTTGTLSVQVAGSLNNSVFEDATNAAYVAQIQAIANSTTYVKGFTVSKAWGGFMMPYVKLIIVNNTGATLTAGTVVYNGVYFA